MKRVVNLVLATVFLASAAYWIALPLYRRWRHDRAMTKIRDEGGYVATNWTYGLVAGFYHGTHPARALPLLTDLAGVRRPAPFGIGKMSDELKHLKNANGLRMLNLQRTDVTDRDLLILGQLPELRSLTLSDTSISDTGLQYVAQCRELLILNLDGTHITSEGLSNLVHLSQLRELTISSTEVDNSAAPYINRLFQLMRLDVGNTYVDREGADSMRDSHNGRLVVENWKSPRRRPVVSQ
jgi:hypothetical protein